MTEMGYNILGSGNCMRKILVVEIRHVKGPERRMGSLE